MRKLLAPLGVLLVACWFFAQAPAAYAQLSNAAVVSACGTTNYSYPVGATRPFTQDTTGKACSSASGGGGGGGAVTVADGADVTQGAKADAACASAATACTVEQRLAAIEAKAEDSTASLVDVSKVGGTTTVNGGVAGSLAVGGNSANNATLTGNPVPQGCQAASAEPTLATNGQGSYVACDLAHKQIVAPYANPENLVQGFTTAMTGTTSTAVTGMGSPGGSLHNYITSLVCGNSHATVGTFVELQDGSGGTTFWTVPAAAVYGGVTITFPAPLRQPTAATALFVKDTTTGANVICSAAGYKGQ